MEFIGQREQFDIIIQPGTDTFVYNFTEIYDVVPNILVEWISKDIIEIITNETSTTIIMKDTVWYTGTGFVIKNEWENTRPLKIFRFISRITNFIKQDYDILGFKKERIFNHGELSAVNYRATRTEQNGYSDLIIRENIVYNRDIYWYISTRDKTITWINENDTDGYTITTVKKYTMAEAGKAWEQARANVLSEMKIATVGLIAQTEQIDISTAEQIGMPFLMGITTQIDLFIQGVRQPIIDAISNDTTYTWLDNDIGGMTIRQYLIAWFTW